MGDVATKLRYSWMGAAHWKVSVGYGVLQAVVGIGALSFYPFPPKVYASGGLVRLSLGGPLLVTLSAFHF